MHIYHYIINGICAFSLILHRIAPTHLMQIQKNISLKKLNTFGIEAFSKLYCEIFDEKDLLAVLNHKAVINEPKLILGGGSNILLTKNFDGITIKNSISGIEKYDENDDHVWVKVGAGVNWHQFVMHAIANNWGGIENLSLIPGTVGAAPMQNIGAYGVEIKSVFVALEAIKLADGSLATFSNKDCNFGYRESIFKNKVKGQFVITRVCFKLTKHHHFNISYGAIQTTLEAMGIDKLSIQAISNAVIKIRQEKLPDPAQIGNAGSFFKNPSIPKIRYEQLLELHPTIPGYHQGDGTIKVPAGWLIEYCGWKGKAFGNIGVHKNQALVLVNYGSGKGEDIKNLAEDIKKSVKDKFDITIQAEVNII